MLARTGPYENPLRDRFGDPFFKELPKMPGVYFFLDADRSPLYIGKADNLKKRLMSYRLARPGTVPDHTLEMLELAAQIKWELHPSGQDALRRETELLLALRPPFNIAGTDPDPYLVLGLRYPKRLAKREGFQKVEFRLSTLEFGEGYTLYGCYRHRRRVKAGYLALLRLLFAASCEKEGFYYPARIAQFPPPYLYATEIPEVWRRPLEKFLRGEKADILRRLSFHLLEKSNVPPFLYGPLQRDLLTAKGFFETGSSATRLAGEGFVSFREMNRFIFHKTSASLVEALDRV